MELFIACEESESNLDYIMELEMMPDRIDVICHFPFKFEAAVLAVVAIDICEEERLMLDLHSGKMRYTDSYYGYEDDDAEFFMRFLDIIHSDVMRIYQRFYRMAQFGKPPEEDKLAVYTELLREGLHRLEHGDDLLSDIHIGTAYLEKDLKDI